ncbi:hypothetical protein GX48_06012 [Paracoccidioides brasiliensis]|nr:hypothetical protein GX48_06012 [Paracoccidioides brasiliensis]
MGPLPLWLTAGLAAVAVSLAAVIIRYLLATKRPKDFPPGPPTLIGIGNLHQIPLKQPFLQFHEWSKTYGDIVGLKIGSSNLVVLHSAQYVRELFEKRGSIYSGRPYSYVHVEHVYREHADKHLLNLQNGPYLRQWRAASSSLLGPAGVRQTIPMQEVTSARLIHELLQATPSKPLEHFKSWALSTPLLAITGQRLENRGKAFSDRHFSAQQQWIELLEPGSAPLAAVVPFLRWVPERFASWKGKARCVRQYMLEEYYGFLKSAKELSNSADDSPKTSGYVPTKYRCLMTKINEESEAEERKGGRRPFNGDQIAYLGGSLLDAAVGTTWATTMSFILLMAAYPDVQAKAREEIDRVSTDKPPGSEVLARLRYLKASLLEMLKAGLPLTNIKVYRFRPPGPHGLPHVTDHDDIFSGYKIPKGTTVLANVWAIHHNADDYDQPNEFRPERYLDNPFGLKPGVEACEGRRATYVFGAGRRICMGEQFAENAILLAMSKLLWAYNISAPESLDLTVETGFHTGLVLSPHPFKVDFVLRDDDRRESVILDYKEASAALKHIGI